MFIGHYAVALAAKPAAPKAPLWILLFAVMWADLLWPILLLLGVESVRLDPGNTAVTPLDFVRYPVSHWVLDWVTHAPDMPLWFGGLNAFMVMVYLSNIFGPPPPSAAAIPWVTLALWLLLPWAAWIERHRPLRVTGE